LKMDAPWSLKCQEPFTHEHSVTLQKTWILSHDTIRTSCLALRVFVP
jgi:hypothetical protein